MPEIELSPGVSLFYRDDDFTDPWRSAETALLLHGSSESGLAWNGWMPYLGRRFRVIRPDARGFGRSTPMPVEYRWTFDALAEDFERLLDVLAIERVHLVGAKIGGPMAVRFAASRPRRVHTLTLLSTPGSPEVLTDPAIRTKRLEQIAREGVESWARDTMKRRLGSACPVEMLEGWAQLMGATPVSTYLGFGRDIGADVSVESDIPKIECPTLVITTKDGGLGTVENIRSWQERIRISELMVLPGDWLHVAATHPEVCAKATLAFIEKHQILARPLDERPASVYTAANELTHRVDLL